MSCVTFVIHQETILFCHRCLHYLLSSSSYDTCILYNILQTRYRIPGDFNVSFPFCWSRPTSLYF